MYETSQEDYYTSNIFLQIYMPIKIYLVFQALHNKDIFVKNKIEYEIYDFAVYEISQLKHNCKYLKDVSMLCNTDLSMLLCNLFQYLKFPAMVDFWGDVFPTCYIVWGLDTAIKTNNMVSWESGVFSN